MLNKQEVMLLNEIIANVDDIKKGMPQHQVEMFRRCFRKIYSNHLVLLEGIVNDNTSGG
jgi:hypothetical protein